MTRILMFYEEYEFELSPSFLVHEIYIKINKKKYN